MRFQNNDPLQQDLGPVEDGDCGAVSFDLYDDLFPTPAAAASNSQ